MKDRSLVSLYRTPDLVLWACKLPGQLYTSIIGLHFYLMVPTNLASAGADAGIYLSWARPFTNITYQGAQWCYSVGSFLTPLILVYACLIVIGLIIKRINSHD
jgi:hypothetical protein